MRVYRLAVVWTAVFMVVSLTAGRARAQGGQRDLGSISVKTVPPDAQVFVDGERWVGTEIDGRLVVQVPPGRHLVEIRAPGFRTYVSEIDVRAGETTPLNVSLAGSAPVERQPTAPPQRTPAGEGGIRQVSSEDEESGFAASADYRFADVNGHTAHLLGGYGGFVFGGHLFVGGGGYGQLDYHRNNVSLAYGGGVVEWRQWTDRPAGVTLHALVGGGDARLRQTVFLIDGPGHHDFRDGYSFDLHRGFFVFEPEAQVNLRVSRDVRLAVGAGYRVTSTERGLSNDVLNGWSGTVSVRFGK